jgi:ComF family protein
MTPSSGATLARRDVRALLADGARSVFNLLLPPACVACLQLLDEGDNGPVCGRCWIRVRALPAPRCERCGHPGDRYACRLCPLFPPWVRALRSVCWVPGGRARDIVHALKYGGWGSVAPILAERMARLEWPSDVIEERVAVIAVPLAASRERERGYNQSALLARHLAIHWRVPDWSAALQRTRATRTQTQLTPEARTRNVSGAFRASPTASSNLRGTHIVLVDDVLTTGATVVACAAALRAAGVRIVSIVTFGRAPAVGDPS